MRRSFVVALLVVLPIAFAHAQTASTTRLIPYAGTAVDASGAPVSGLIAVTVELYEEQDGGVPLWRETQHARADDRGRYLIYLGSATPLPQAAFTEERARWLAVSVGSQTQPRVMLVAVPYALRAADADTLGGQPASAFVRTGLDGRIRTSAGAIAEPLIDGGGTPGQLAKYTTATTVGDSIVTETATNRIGIGTTDPTEGGAIDSRMTIRTNDGTTALAISNQMGVPRFALNVNGDGSWITYDRALGTYRPGIAQHGGRVGVSTTDPTGAGVVDSKFTVRNLDNNTGIAVLNQANARRFALNTTANGGWKMYDGGSGAWNEGLVQLDGRVGLGTNAPDARLRIAATNADGIFVTQTDTTGRHAIRAKTPAGTSAIMGIAGSSTLDAWGFSIGVYGVSDNGWGVSGTSAFSYGVVGLAGEDNVIGAGIRGVSLSTADAGSFSGNVTVTGTLTKGGGSFKIDHPLDPENKYLLHSFVESPDMMNVYNGNVVLNAEGEAWVALPDWFEALNRDFRYQLTAIGAPGPNLHVATKVSGNRFRIAGGVVGGEVSWQLTGVRQDAWANAHRIGVEQDKPSHERGSYLHPAEHGQPESTGQTPTGVATSKVTNR